MKRVTTILFCSLLCCSLIGQNFNSGRTDLALFLSRMYESSPFEGVRVVEDYDNCYLLSVLALSPANYQSSSAMNRVAAVKAMSQASRYFNGSVINSELIIHTTQKGDKHSDTEIIEHIQENSIGYVQQMELLTSFEKADEVVFIFIKQMIIPDDNTQSPEKKGRKKKQNNQ